MSTKSISEAIAALVNSIEAVGVFHPLERFAKSQKDLKEFYVVNGLINGGFVGQVARIKVSADGGGCYTVTTNWELLYYKSFVDADETGNDMNDLLDGIAEVFDSDLTIGGEVDTTITEQQAGIRLLNSQPAMFCGVLVHYAKMSLITEHTES